MADTLIPGVQHPRVWGLRPDRVDTAHDSARTPDRVANTPDFTDGPIDGVRLRPLSAHQDNRGWLIELFREDELSADGLPAMAYVSETLPGIARGPHEHVDQTDYFAFLGPGEFLLYLWDARPDSPTHGRRMKVAVGQSNRQCVIVPPGVVHAYQNIGETPGWVFNAPNRLYAGPGRRTAVDEIRHEQRQNSPYRLD
ncbi:MAG: dTDP-4-dehydrorhamnose 3,5-epimerase family protein [Planctomycetaceae bacterium]|nr:dTDP-4-dehydrorhamnose 3,5-epimerase family protein [Planctomycetaceae bacterium]